METNCLRKPWKPIPKARVLVNLFYRTGLEKDKSVARMELHRDATEYGCKKEHSSVLCDKSEVMVNVEPYKKCRGYKHCQDW